MDKTITNILKTVSGLSDLPSSGAFNVRVNGKSAGFQSTENITIKPKTDVSGIDVLIKPNAKNETVHIPVVIDTSGHQELVYNDFYIGENSDVLIIAGCGIHNDGDHLTQHDGIHTFHVGKNAHVTYVEKHYGEGKKGDKVLNPVTNVILEENAVMEMDTVQIDGVDNTKRETFASVGDGARIIIKEKLMTTGTQKAITNYTINLDGDGASSTVSSRSVAKGISYQEFNSKLEGNNICHGHSECDAIIMDSAKISALPIVVANHVDATLIHEAAIGKIAGEQIIKLMSLGLTQEEAEHEIITGFLQ